MNAAVPRIQAQIDLHASVGEAPAAIAVMHCAFAEYSAKGATSGAMLETAESLQAEMNAGLRLGVARRDGELIAMVKYRSSGDGTIYFSRLSVLPTARGYGLARALVQALRTEALNNGLSGLTCCVRANEAGNIALYRKLGMDIIAHEDRPSLTGAIIPVVHLRDRQIASHHHLSARSHNLSTCHSRTKNS